MALAGVDGGLDGAAVWQAVGVESGDNDGVELEALGSMQSRQGHARIAAGAWVRSSGRRAAVGDEGAEQGGTVLRGERLPTPLLEHVRVGDELDDVVEALVRVDVPGGCQCGAVPGFVEHGVDQVMVKAAWRRADAGAR